MDEYNLNECPIDSDRIPMSRASDEGLWGGVLTCSTCYLFLTCSSNDLNKRAESCHVLESELMSVAPEV